MLHTFDISGSLIDGIPFTAAPRLKRLGLYFSPCPNPTSVSAIPLDQLVELTIGDIQTIPKVVEVIQRCPRLESLWLRVDEGDEDGSLTSRSITQHDTLRRLHLNTLPYVNAVTDCLTLPALTDLSLRTHCSIPEIEAKICCSQLVAFFTRSNCELQKFTLYRSGLGPGELLECLSHRSCQTLTQLVIEGDESSPPMVDRELLIRLKYSDVDDDLPLCPKLRHLELNGRYCSDRLFPDLLGRMIQSRCFGRTQDAQLGSLRLCNRYSVSSEDYELLQFAQSNGGLELGYSYVI
ncbi:hypothetical protein M378DRAFT_160087 [Amanita muscaria Koide BX008]|uniref:Uncharacterized protein n=1 Tax=Amanita muscaria (strain Koide BX008) TaxID=946122 RepID=A0A0C2XE64_AMAMK|nr:hypothetical protein M378DRAFT_160087 [Amanita muscaria Koide BX008]